MRNHNQLDVWQKSLCNLPDLFFLFLEKFAGADLAEISVFSGKLTGILTRICGATIRELKTGLTSRIPGRIEGQLLLRMSGCEITFAIGDVDKAVVLLDILARVSHLTRVKVLM